MFTGATTKATTSVTQNADATTKATEQQQTAQQQPTSQQKQQTLRQLVKDVVRNYIKQLDGEEPTKVHDMLLEEIESAELEEMMKCTRYNQSKAATWLGISRGTLRKKLKKYDLL